MYLGHFAVGLAARPVASKTSLGILLVATQVIDILYPIFLIVGIGRLGGSVWDHGLVMSLVWSAVAFGIFCAVSRDMRSGLLVGFLVFSHWIGDFVAYRVLPIAFNDLPKVGLGLYSSLQAMLLWDFGLFSLALAYYLFRTKAKDRIGKWAPWLLVLYLILLMPAAMLPGKLIAIMALGMALVLPFGIWIDRHRSVIPVPGKKPDMLKA